MFGMHRTPETLVQRVRGEDEKILMFYAPPPAEQGFLFTPSGNLRLMPRIPLMSPNGKPKPMRNNKE